MPSRAGAAAPAAGPDRFTGDLAYAHVVQLADAIGVRAAGTPNDAAATDYIAETLRGYGYDVELQEFPFTYFEDRGSSLVLGDGQALKTRAFTYSISGEVEGELVYVGLGRPEDYPEGGISGKIALVQRGEITFQAKLANAQQAGAIGLVVFNNDGGLISPTLGGTSTIPAVFIAQSDGEALRERVRREAVTARIVTNTVTQERHSRNVVARLPGASGPQLVVGAHHDSVPAGPGANDNASGTATMLEMARVVAQNRPPVDYRFVAFGAEELGLIGSRYFVRQLSDGDRNAIAGMINLDMVGVGDRLLIGGSEELQGRAIRLAGSLGTSAGRMGSGLSNGGSDHASFIAAGIPAVFFYWSNDPNYHTAEDKATYVQAELLQKTGDIAFAVAESITGQRVQ